MGIMGSAEPIEPVLKKSLPVVTKTPSPEEPVVQLRNKPTSPDPVKLSSSPPKIAETKPTIASDKPHIPLKPSQIREEARKSAVYTKRTSNENILGSSNNNNDKENNKPISHPPPSTLKSKFQPEKEEIKNNSSSENKNSSKQVIESSPAEKLEKETRTSTQAANA